MGKNIFQNIAKAQMDAVKSVEKQAESSIKTIASAAEKALRPEALPQQPEPSKQDFSEAAQIQQEKRWVAQELKKLDPPKAEPKPQVPSYATPTAINRADAQAVARQAPAYATPTQINRADTQVYTPKTPTLPKVQQDTGSYTFRYSPEVFQWQIDALEEELEQLRQQTQPGMPYAQGPVPTPDTPYAAGLQAKQADSLRTSIDQHAKIKELEKELEEVRATKQYVEDLVQVELARINPEAFQRNLAAWRQNLARTQAEEEERYGEGLEDQHPVVKAAMIKSRKESRWYDPGETKSGQSSNDIRKTIKQLENIQKRVGYEAYQQLEDFEELGKPGETRGEYGGFLRAPADAAFLYDFINDLGEARSQVGFTDRDGHYRVFVGEGRPGGSYQKYLYLTPAEKMTFNAIDKLESEEAALAYLDFMTEELNWRQGADTYENMHPVSKTLYWAPAGVDQFASGMAQLFSKKALPTSPVQYTSALVRDEAHDINPVLGFAYDAGTTVSNVAPSILAAKAAALIGGPAAGEAVGNTLMGLSSAGNAYNQKVKEGYGPEQSRSYAALVGASEALLQYYLGGIAQLGGVDKAKILDRVAKIDNGLVRFVATAGVHGLPELGEEGLQALLAPAFASIIFGEDYEVDPGDVVYSALMGFVMGDVFALPDIIGVDTKKPASIEEAGVGQYRLTKPRNVDMPTVPIIDLSIQDIPFEGGELPSVGNSLRNDAIARARTRLGLDKNSAFYLPASNVTRDGNEYILKITKASLNKMLSPATQGAIPLESIVVIDNIERIANNGVWFEGEGDRRGRKQIAGIDHLKTTVYIDGAPYLVDMRVRLVETSPGQGVDNVLYYYTPEEIITVERVGTTSPTGERRALTGESETMPTLNQSIPQTAPGVNPAEGASVDAKTGTSAPGDTTTSALAPKIKNQESATSVNRVLELARQATAMAEGEHGTPDWVPQKIRDALKPLTDLNLAAAKRKALGDLLGLSPEFQKNIPIALDKILADADDIARWESLELSPDLQEFIQPQLEEKKNDLQWLEERLAKLEEGEQATQELSRPNGENLEIKQKKLYNEQTDREQFDSYQLILPADEFPSSFEEFQDIKYTERERYIAIEEKVKLYKTAERTGTIPNPDVVITPSAKFERYLLDPTHSRGKDKAYVIEKVLGYDISSWEEFVAKLCAEIQKSPVKGMVGTENGVKYIVPVIMWGKKGRYLYMDTIWQIDKGSNIPRFITATFPERKEK